jgi:hypothetical protein
VLQNILSNPSLQNGNESVLSNRYNTMKSMQTDLKNIDLPKNQGDISNKAHNRDLAMLDLPVVDLKAILL